MSFFKRLFGGGEKANAVMPAEAPIDYKGHAIVAAPLVDNGQFRVAGSVSKEIGGETKTHRFIRADVFADRDAAIQATIRKAQLIIDQSGDSVY